MAALMTIAGPGEYASSGIARPPAIVQPSCGPSPLGSDLHAAFLAWMRGVLDQVEGHLLAWYKTPDAFADDETDAPSQDAIRAAFKFLQTRDADLAHLLENGFPLRGATIGSGGAISLEFGRGGTVITYTFEPDGSAERLVFVDGRLCYRNQLDLSRG